MAQTGNCCFFTCISALYSDLPRSKQPEKSLRLKSLMAAYLSDVVMKRSLVANSELLFTEA